MKALELAGRLDDRAKNLEAVPGFEDLDFLVRDRDFFLQAAAKLRRLAAVEAELERIKALPPVAVRYDCDGYGWQYIDDGSGSDWLTRHKDGEALYALGSKTHE